MADDEAGSAAHRWERLQDVFHRALECAPEARDAFVEHECAGDDALAADVRAMLAADAASGEILAGGLAAAADRVLDDPTAAAAGRKFGPYRTVGLLGEGGMGVVLRARRDDLGSEAAIKVLRDFSLSPARRERFAFEQRALAQLDHPNIARLFDADVLADGTPWFAMELVDGRPLNEYCAEQRLTLEARLELFRKVCDAVQHAHGRAILHRDLKPSNILVRPDGSVKLLDFGIAKSIDTLDTPELATRTGLRMMTPAYASPEQMSGEGVGVYSDVYSLGVLLYELLTGRLPFELAGRTPSEAARILTEQPLRAPSTVTAELRPAGHASRDGWRDLDVICLTAMHRDVARRYATVDALRSDLDRFLAGLPVHARGDSFGYLASKFVRRHAVQVGIAAVALVLLVGVVTVYTLRLNTERDRAQRMASRAQRVQKFMQDLLRGDDEQVGPSDTLRVVTLLRNGVGKAAALASEPEAKADFQWTLGRLLLARGQLDEADSLIKTAYTFVARSPHPEPEDLVGLTIDLAMLRAAQERWPESEALAREALARADAGLAPTHESALLAISTLGAVLWKEGKDVEADSVLEVSIERMQRSGEVTDLLLGTVNDLAILRFNAGDDVAAESLFRYVAQLARKKYGPRHPNVADDLIDLAAVEQRTGHYEAADSLNHEALGIVREWYGAESPKTADVMSITARNLLVLHRYDEADSLLRSALAILERAYGPDHSIVGRTWGGLASLAEARKDAVGAEAAYKRAADIARRKFGPHHLHVGLTIGNLGTFYLHQGKLVSAERCFREELVAFEGAVLPEAVDFGVAHLRLGRALLMQKRIAEAEKETALAYCIIAPQVDTTNVFLRAAINDLHVEYTALGRLADAARFRPQP